MAEIKKKCVYVGRRGEGDWRSLLVGASSELGGNAAMYFGQERVSNGKGDWVVVIHVWGIWAEKA